MRNFACPQIEKGTQGPLLPPWATRATQITWEMGISENFTSLLSDKAKFSSNTS